MANEDISCIEAIAKIVKELDLEAISYSKDSLNIVINNKTSHVAVPVATQPTIELLPTKQENEEAIAPKTTKGEQIKSPMVGVLYLAPNPDEAPYVKVGDRVNAGDVLCLIEAMKTFNQIKSTKSGIVKEILVDSGMAVEFDEPLFVIE